VAHLPYPSALSRFPIGKRLKLLYFLPSFGHQSMKKNREEEKKKCKGEKTSLRLPFNLNLTSTHSVGKLCKIMSGYY